MITAQGKVSSDPMHLLADHTQALAKLWKASGSMQQLPGDVQELLSAKGQELQEISPQDIRAAANTFSPFTAVSFDGFFMRHFAMLPQDALVVLAKIFALMELATRVPTQLALLIMCLQPKPKGGFRPITLFAGPVRLWSRLRSVYARAWEQAHDIPAFACAKGRSPVDAVWRQALLAETSESKRECAAVVMLDGHKFYETIPLAHLLKEGIKAGFNNTILVLLIKLYMSGRHVRFAGMLMAKLHALAGLPAGCICASAMTKIHYGRALKAFLYRNPAVTLDVFVDDFGINVRGAHMAVVENITLAVRDLEHVMTAELGAALHWARVPVLRLPLAW